MTSLTWINFNFETVADGIIFNGNSDEKVVYYIGNDGVERRSSNIYMVPITIKYFNPMISFFIFHMFRLKIYGQDGSI